MVDQLRVQNDLSDRFVEGAHIAHDADQMDAFEYHLGTKTFFKSKNVFDYCQNVFLTIEIPNKVRVNSGPAERTSRSRKAKTQVLMARMCWGIIITMAADTRKKAQIRPLM